MECSEINARLLPHAERSNELAPTELPIGGWEVVALFEIRPDLGSKFHRHCAIRRRWPVPVPLESTTLNMSSWKVDRHTRL